MCGLAGSDQVLFGHPSRDGHSPRDRSHELSAVTSYKRSLRTSNLRGESSRDKFMATGQKTAVTDKQDQTLTSAD